MILDPSFKINNKCTKELISYWSIPSNYKHVFCSQYSQFGLQISESLHLGTMRLHTQYRYKHSFSLTRAYKV